MEQNPAAIRQPPRRQRLADRMTARYADHDEIIEPGDAFYMSPGHVSAAEAGSEFVMFSPKDELAISEAALKANMQRLQEHG